MIDLHLHSTYSDGTSTPSELVSHGVGLGLRAVALTDHDTVDGVDELMTEAARLKMDALPGVELSAGICPLTKDHQREVHILGYFPKWDDEIKAALEPLRQVQKWREERNRAIVENMRGYNIPITYEDLVALAGTPNVGRPHFANWLIEHGFAHSVGEAFQQFLIPGALTFKDRRTFDIAESLDLIRRAKGVAVLAHPKALHIFFRRGFREFPEGHGGPGAGRHRGLLLRASARRHQALRANGAEV